MTALEKKSESAELPYEKFLLRGAESLSDAELLAVILRTGTKNRSALDLGQDILNSVPGKRYGLLCLHYLSTGQLQKISGIGEVKAVRLKCISEIAVRMSMKRAKDGLCFQNAASIAEYYMETLRHRRTECVLLLMLDMKGTLLNDIVLSEGTVSSSPLSGREVFLQALRYEAVNIILLHNHPSGECSPSRQDILITEQLRKSGQLLDIPLLDHIIIGDCSYFSFKESGYL